MKDNKLDKKGQLNNLLSMLFVGGIMIVIVIITLAIGSEITQDLRTQNQGTLNETGIPNQPSSLWNVTSNGLAGLANMSGQMGLIGTVIALSVVLLILVTLLFRQFGGTRF